MLLTATVWGMGFVAQSVGLEYVGVYTFTCVRSFIAGIVLIPCIWFLNKINKKDDIEPEAKDGQLAGSKTLLSGGICCGILLTIASILQQIGVQYTTVGKAGFITAFYIIIVPILGIFMKKRCAKTVWVGVVFALAGLYCLCITEGTGNATSTLIQKGDWYVLLCAVVFSFHILCIDYFSEKADGVKMSCIQFFVCGILTVGPMLLLEQPSWQVLLTVWKPLLYAGAISGGVGYTLQIVGQKGMNPTIASLILSLEAVVSVIGGLVILGQMLSKRELLGCALMFVAIVLAQLPERKAI